jgi:Glyoxalase-like domain
MTSRFRQWTLDVLDTERMARFWSAALGYDVDAEADGTTHLRPPAGSR